MSAKERSPGKLLDMPLEYLVWAIVSVAVVGVGASIGVMALMREWFHFAEGLILGVAFLSFLPFLAAECAFIWLLLRSSGGAGTAIQARGAATKGLEPAQPQVLPEPALSVTEHTTRTLERAHAQQRLNEK